MARRAHRLLVVSVAYETAQSTAPGAQAFTRPRRAELKFWRRRLLKGRGSPRSLVGRTWTSPRGGSASSLCRPRRGVGRFLTRDVFIDAPARPARVRQKRGGGPTRIVRLRRRRAVERHTWSGGARSSPAGSERAGGVLRRRRRSRRPRDRDRDGDRPTPDGGGRSFGERGGGEGGGPSASRAAATPPGITAPPVPARTPPRLQPPPSSSGGGPSSGPLFFLRPMSSRRAVAGESFPADASAPELRGASHPLDARAARRRWSGRAARAPGRAGRGVPSRRKLFRSRLARQHERPDSLLRRPRAVHFRMADVEDERVQAYFLSKCFCTPFL